jgi:hypothetical protein
MLGSKKLGKKTVGLGKIVSEIEPKYHLKPKVRKIRGVRLPSSDFFAGGGIFDHLQDEDIDEHDEDIAHW